MKATKIFKSSAVLAGIVSALISFNAIAETASPTYFITKNYTPYASNAKIRGQYSPHPTPAGSPDNPSENKVRWIGVKMICGVKEPTCDAEIWMNPNTDNEIYVGTGTMDTKTGDITPKRLESNGFVVTTSAPGTLEIREAGQ